MPQTETITRPRPQKKLHALFPPQFKICSVKILLSSFHLERWKWNVAFKMYIIIESILIYSLFMRACFHTFQQLSCFLHYWDLGSTLRGFVTHDSQTSLSQNTWHTWQWMKNSDVQSINVHSLLDTTDAFGPKSIIVVVRKQTQIFQFKWI